MRDNFDGIDNRTKKLCKIRYDLNDIFRYCCGDEKVILLNMIENINNKNVYKIYNFVELFNDKDIFKKYELLNIPISFINKYINYDNHKIIYNRYVR